MRFRPPVDRAFAGLIGIAVGLLLTAGAGIAPAAAQQSVYQVSGISIDATAETAAQARETAIGDAHIGAMQALYRRMVMAPDVPRLPILTADQIASYVQDFSVANERSSAGRYLADFTFRFKRDAMRGLFQQYGVRFAETQSKPLVVLPVLGQGEAAQLWQEGNPWLRSWAEGRFDEGLVPIVTPLGDLSDVATITPLQALSGDGERLRTMASRYNSAGALVAQATLSGDPEQGTAALSVTASRFDDGRLTTTGVVNARQLPGEDLPTLLARAATDVSAVEQNRWKQSNLLNFGTRETIFVTVPIGSLGAWLDIKRRLENISSVIAADVRKLKRAQVDLALTYLGTREQLTRALAQQDLQLTAQANATGVGPSGLGGYQGLATSGTENVYSALSAQGQTVWELRVSGTAPSGATAGGTATSGSGQTRAVPREQEPAASQPSVQ